MLAVLRRRDFTLLWFGGLISEIGDWLLLIGLPVYVFMLTSSTLAMATVFILELVPAVVFGSLAGVLVDRWNRQVTMVVVATAQGVLLLPLLAVHHSDQLWIVYLIAPAQALLAQLFEPARSAALPTLVPAEDLVSANSLMGLSANVARLIGSSLGGLAVASGGLTTVVIGDAVTYLLAALVIAIARFPRKGAGHGSEAERPTLLRAWYEGMAFIISRRDVRNLLLSTAAGSIAQGMFLVLFVVFVAEVLHGGGTEIGVLRGVQAIGGVIGGFVIAWVGARAGHRSLIVGGALLVGLLSLTMWNSSYFTQAMTLYVLLFIAVGIPGIANSTGTFALLQQALPDEYLGRVMAAFLTVFGGFQALGMLIAGLADGFVDTVVLLDVQAGFYILAAVIAYFGLSRKVPGAAAGRLRNHPTGSIK
ncbi:MFS transporter [Nonomuraea sp. NPDC049714]|uniref:MFS transporter n=1 Tax=Nonomuraea sp. NPDC049714 TaxID=3364357 RepID=UPI0037AA5491